MHHVGGDLVWEGYGSRLLSNLFSLHEHGTLCDLTLVAENEEFRVHKAVMAASSDYFKSLLTLDMKEKDQRTVTLKGVPSRGLTEVVRFAYTGNLRCNLGNISDVLLAATHLQLTEAIDLCSQFLTNMTNTSNSVDMYNLAEQFNLPRLQNKSLDLILENFEEVSDQVEYLCFTEKFMAQILENNHLKIASELKLFQIVLNWISYNPKERSKYAFFLMSRVRFPLIPPQDLVEIVMAEPLMKTDAQCLELVLESNRYHMLPERQPTMQSLRSQVRNDSPSIVLMDVDDEGPKVFDLGTKNWITLRNPQLNTFHAQICTVQNYVYVCGGIELYSSNNPVSAKCYRYDPRFDTWNDIQPMQESRHHFVLCSDGYSLFAIGGYCNGIYKSVVERYSVRSNTWSTRKSLDHGLSAAASAVVDGCIYICGGQNERGIRQSLFRYKIKADQWKECPPMHYARMDHTMCSHDNKLFAIGGYDKNIIKAFDVNKVECFELETNQWSILQESGPKFSGIYSSQNGSCVYIVGGFSYDENKKRSEMWCFNIESGEWSMISRLLAPTMSVPTCCLYFPRHMFHRSSQRV